VNFTNVLHLQNYYYALLIARLIVKDDFYTYVILNISIACS